MVFLRKSLIAAVLVLAACLLFESPVGQSSWEQAPTAIERTATERATFYVGMSALAAAAVALSERERDEERLANPRF